jgi:hypothetical protein
MFSYHVGIQQPEKIAKTNITKSTQQNSSAHTHKSTIKTITFVTETSGAFKASHLL